MPRPASSATDNVALDLSGTALAGRKASLRIEGGKLILNVVSAGTILVVW